MKNHQSSEIKRELEIVTENEIIPVFSLNGLLKRVHSNERSKSKSISIKPTLKKDLEAKQSGIFIWYSFCTILHLFEF